MVLIKFSFVLLYVRGMVQVVVVQDTAGIPCIFIHFISIINKRTGVLIKHVDYRYWFFQGFFLQLLFVSWCAGRLFSSFWIVGHASVNWTAVLTKQHKDRRALGMSH